MPSVSTEWARKHRKILVLLKGGKCLNCQGNTRLEFAHVWPTDLSGMGRGTFRRIDDIRRNFHAYILLCRSCHRDFDAIEE